MQRVTRTLALGLAAAAVGAAPAQGQGQGEPPGANSPCQTAFIAVPALLAPDADKNEDGIVCVKPTPGQSEVFVFTDDRRPPTGP